MKNPDYFQLQDPKKTDDKQVEFLDTELCL